MSKSDSIGQLAVALAKVQSQIENVQKTRLARVQTKSGGEYRYTYTTLADVYDVCREPLAANGLSVSQLPTDIDGSRVGLTTILMHESGEWLSATSSMPVSPNATPQDVGGALTYLRRYHLVSVIGMAMEDDDAAQASGKNTQHEHVQRQQTQQQPQQQRAASNGAATAGGLATEPQLRLVHKLVTDNGWSEADTLKWAKGFDVTATSFDKLTKSEASTLIEQIKAYNDQPAEQSA